MRTGFRRPAMVLAALLALTLALRVAAAAALGMKLESDAIAYFALAQSLASGHWPVDNLGQHAFYSIGYPLLLAPAFALLGASIKTALAVNLLLALWSAGLVCGLAGRLGLPLWGQWLSVAVYALWMPGIWNCAMLARENLSTPLLLATALLALRLLDDGPKLRLTFTIGLTWGAALLTGTSALPILAAPLLALGFAGGLQAKRLAAPLLALGAGAVLVISPWLAATEAMLGAPMLTSNSGFNLYLGNNPAATGKFISIAKTPAGPGWKALRAARGEAGATGELGRRALAWMRDNPARTAALSARKLALFWAPNLPKPADFAASRALALVRVAEVTQYAALLLLAAAALAFGAVAARQRWVLAALIAGFWALHGIAYIIPRYRDPVMPLLIVLASAAVCALARAGHSGSGHFRLASPVTPIKDSAHAA